MKYLILPLLLVLLVSSCKKKIEGCTDSTMYNYDSLADEDNGSCISFVYGCKDMNAYNYNANANTDDNTCINSFVKILTEQGYWKISTSVIDPPVIFADGEVSDYLLFTLPCRKDDLIDYNFFGGIGTYTIKEGATKCDPSDSDTYEAGNWDVNTDSTIFYMTPNGFSTVEWEIKKISDQEFILEGTGDFQGDGVMRTKTKTFVHQ
tara:strand:- start:552 stop:1169 length:618 start_codon:yes stop_codon:yes gene_type:complete